MSGSVSTNASSKISQFGLYRTIDSRTEEFLKLSKKRQIRQGCACAAVSTAITVTIVVGFLLIYEYSIVPHNRKVNAKETWQTITSESDEDSSFEKKLNSKSEVNTIPKTSLIQAGLLEALSRNKFIKKQQLVGVKPTNYQRETTLASVYKINKLSEFKNRYTKSKEHSTTPNFSKSSSKLSFQSKVKPSASYDNAFIKQYISKMIEKYIKSYKAQVVGRGDSLPKTTSTTTTETITLNVISLNREKHKVLKTKKSPDSCMCQWNLSQILKKIMKCVMNLGSQSKQKLCQNCKSTTKPTTVKTNYAYNISLNNRKTNKGKTMSKSTSQKPYLGTPEDKKKTDLVNSPYINTLKEVLKLKAPYGKTIKNFVLTSTEKSTNVFNATNGFSSKQILMNSLRDKHCTFFKDYISRLRKNKTFQSQIYDNQVISQPGDIKINDSFYSDIFDVVIPVTGLEQSPYYKPTVAPSSTYIPENFFDLNTDPYFKSQESQTQKPKDIDKNTQFSQDYMQPKTQIPSTSTATNFETNFFENEIPYTPTSKIENMKSIFEQDTETVQTQTATSKNQEQQYNVMQDDKYFIAEDDDMDEDDDILSISRTKDANNTDSIYNQPPFKNEVNNELTFVQGAEYNTDNQQPIQNDAITDYVTTEKQFKWYKKHQVKYSATQNPNRENDFFDQLTKKFNAAEDVVADKRKNYRFDQHYNENEKSLQKKQQSVYSATSIGRPSYLEIIRNYRNQDYDHDNRFSDNDYIN